MQRAVLAGSVFLAVLALLVTAAPAPALVARISVPAPQRAAQADTVVIGKVTAIEDKTVSAPPTPGADKVEYTIAVIKIDDALLGAAGLTHIRVGFFNQPAGGGPIDAKRPPIRRPQPQPVLLKDQEVCVFLTKHPQESFHVMVPFCEPIDRKNAKEIDSVKRCCKVLAEPNASLKSKDADERLLAASLLLSRYRTFRGPGNPKQEPIDAEQSKLILLALADADWNRRPAPGNLQVYPQTLFNQLGVGPKDGWQQPRVVKEIPEAAKKWLRDNAETYRIQRYVPDQPAEK